MDYTRATRAILVQFPIALIWSVLWDLPRSLVIGALRADFLRYVTSCVLQFLDGFQLYTFQRFNYLMTPISTNGSITSILQCQELLGYPVPNLPESLSPIYHPELANHYGIRLTMVLGLGIPAILLSWLLFELLNKASEASQK